MTGRETAQRVAYFAAAPLLSLLAFHRAFSTWFLNDDFGWMALRTGMQERGLAYLLFHPLAQGTVRILSERIPFLVFPALFPLDPLPYRLLAFTTWIAALTLVALIGTRLAGSQAAGLIAAIFVAVNGNLTRPLAWASSYNEVLCAACVLMAFYARLRGWRIAEWIAYLGGLATLEVAVVYPAIAALYAVCFNRNQLRSALWLFIPAAIFGAWHAFFIPYTGGADYQIAIDGRIASTLFQYLTWLPGSAQIYQFTGEHLHSGPAAAILVGAALLAFALWRSAKRDPLPLFCCAWFLLLLGPLLVLPNHFIEYALTTPMIGLAWLGGAGVAAGWRAGWLWRSAAAMIALIYAIPAFYEADLYTTWWHDRAQRIQAVVEQIESAKRAHPGSVFLIQGIDTDVFNSGFEDNPFALIDARVYLTPGSEPAIPAGVEDRQRWLISPRGAFALIENGRARVITLTGTTARDTTAIYEAVLRADPSVTRVDFIDAADTTFAPQIGSGWYSADGHLRWMGKTASLKMAGPASASQKLIVTGYAPGPLLTAGPVTLHFSANGMSMGDGVVREADHRFSFELPFPATLVGQKEIELTIEASHTIHYQSDGRELGMAFGTFAIR
jgi:hypothetical protein